MAQAKVLKGEDHYKRRKRAQRRNGREIVKAAKKVDAQKRSALVRAKYGPSLRSAPVTVRHLDGVSGEWVEVGTVHQRDVRELARRRDAG